MEDKDISFFGGCEWYGAAFFWTTGSNLLLPSTEPPFLGENTFHVIINTKHVEVQLSG